MPIECEHGRTVDGGDFVPEPEGCETLVVDAPLSLAELVEDELLLAMPMSPGHAEGQCEVAFPVTVGKVPAAEKRVNPFTELRGFKDKNQ